LGVGEERIQTHDRGMQTSRQRVIWKWSDTSRLCDVTPTARSFVPRCPIFVWGTIDRVRGSVAVRMWKRLRTGSQTIQYVRQRKTPLAMPDAQEGEFVRAVRITDGSFIPRILTLATDRQQVVFVNSSRLPHTIVFERAPGKRDQTNNRALDFMACSAGDAWRHPSHGSSRRLRRRRDRS